MNPIPNIDIFVFFINFFKIAGCCTRINKAFGIGRIDLAYKFQSKVFVLF